MTADSLETTVVVGEDESVWRHHYTGTESGEVDNRLHDGVVATVESVVRQVETVGLHLLIHCLGKVVESPHSLVSLGAASRQSQQSC